MLVSESRKWQIGIPLCLVQALLYWKLAHLPPLPKVVPAYLVLFSGAFITFLTVSWLLTRLVESRRILWLILGGAILFRVILLPSMRSMSTDVYRYIWDAKMTAHGIGPYRYPPNDRHLAPLRDGLHKWINYQGVRSPYPPAAEILYRGLYMLPGNRVIAFKFGLVLFDVATIGVLLAILRKLGRRPEWVILYAWHPLVITEVALGPHIDAAGTFFVALALLLGLELRGWALSAVSLTLAALIKPHPGFLVPIMIRRFGWRYTIPVVAIVVLLFLPFRHGIHEFVMANQVIANWGEANSSLFRCANALFARFFQEPAAWARALSLAVAIGASLAFSVRPILTPQDGIQRAFHVLVIIMLAWSTVYPWYLLWTVPFLVLFPSPGWLLYTGLIALCYARFQDGHPSIWPQYVEYLPVYALLAMECLSPRFRTAWGQFLGIRESEAETPRTAEAPLESGPPG